MIFDLQLFGGRGGDSGKGAAGGSSGSSNKNGGMETKSFKVMDKTFKVINGVVEVSGYDRQKRIDAVSKKAKQNGWKVKFTF